MGIVCFEGHLTIYAVVGDLQGFARWLNQQPQAVYNDVFVFIRLKQGFAPKVVSGKKRRVFGEDGSHGLKR
jgi:hypothetical protein